MSGRPEDAAGRGRLAAGVLVGPTASGKTDVAHAIARRAGMAVVSADSMLVYQGMDIGTAKPSLGERRGIGYHGIDLTTPDRPFSVGEYLRGVRESLSRAPAGAPCLVAGGTGLYVRCLVDGLDPQPAASDALRVRAEEMLRRDGVGALQRWLEELAPDALSGVADPLNPRRLIRAIERASGGAGASGPAHRATPRQSVFAGLRPTPELLLRRIRERVRRMYEGGLLEEVAGLRTRYRTLSATAVHAIGYREALDCLDGALRPDEALERTVLRTRQLARRQLAWFRRQARVEWIEWSDDRPADEVARRVEDVWSRNGPVELSV